MVSGITPALVAHLWELGQSQPLLQKIVYEYKQYMAKTEYLKQVMEAQKEIVSWLDAQQGLLQEKIDYCNEESSRMR